MCVLQIIFFCYFNYIKIIFIKIYIDLKLVQVHTSTLFLLLQHSSSCPNFSNDLLDTLFVNNNTCIVLSPHAEHNVHVMYHVCMYNHGFKPKKDLTY